MRHTLLAAVAFVALCGSAHAQLVSNPSLFPSASLVTGNCVQATGPNTVASTGTPCGSGGGGGSGNVVGPTSSTIGTIPVWSNGTGTGLANSSLQLASIPQLGDDQTWGGLNTFNQRPLFGLATPWDSANFNPADYLTIANATSTYLTIANAASTYLSKTTASSTYFPLVGGTLPRLDLTAANGVWKPITFNTGSSQRWQLGSNNDGESTGNLGSNFDIFSYGNDGAVLANILHIVRSTGVATWSTRPLFGTATPWDSANFDPTLYLTIANAAATYTTPAEVDAALSTFVTRTYADAHYLGIFSGQPVLGLGPFSNGISGNSTAASFIAESGGGSIQTVNLYPNATTGLAAAGFPSQALSSMVQAGDTALLAVANGASTFVVGAGATNANSPAGIRFTTSGSGSIAMGLRPTFAGSLAWDSGNFNPSLYLTTANAASTYLTQANAASTYLTSATAAATYATQAALALKAPIASPTFTGVTTLTGGGEAISAASGIWKPISFNTGSSQRWQIGSDNTPETGSNAGSNFGIFAYADNGASLFQVLNITRATGVANFGLRPTFNGATPWDSNNFNSALYLTTATAASTYLPIATAASTYLTQTNAASTYLTQANAASTYLKLAGGTVTGAVQFNVTPTIANQALPVSDSSPDVPTTSWVQSVITNRVGTGPFIPLTGVGMMYDIQIGGQGLNVPAPGSLPSAYRVLYYTFVRKVVFPANFVGSSVSAAAPATANTVISVARTGSTVVTGTLTFASGVTKGVFSFAGPQTFLPGDVLSMITNESSTNPALADATLGGITGTLAGTISQ